MSRRRPDASRWAESAPNGLMTHSDHVVVARTARGKHALIYALLFLMCAVCVSLFAGCSSSTAPLVPCPSTTTENGHTVVDTVYVRSCFS